MTRKTASTWSGSVFFAVCFLFSAHSALATTKLSDGDVNSLSDQKGVIGITYKDGTIVREGLVTFAAEVTAIAPQSSFGSTRLSVGDKIFAVQGKYFDTSKAFQKYIAAHQPGLLVDITFFDAETMGDVSAVGRLVSREMVVSSLEPSPKPKAAALTTVPLPSAPGTDKSTWAENCRDGALKAAGGSLLFGAAVALIDGGATFWTMVAALPKTAGVGCGTGVVGGAFD